MSDGERVFIAETTGSGAGAEDFHTITAHKDGSGLLLQTHWHMATPTDFSTATGLTEFTMGFTLLPDGLVALRDAINIHLKEAGDAKDR